MVDPSPFINALIGCAVSDIWLLPVGPGLSIDFGQLTPKKSEGISGLDDELNLMIDSDWRIEREQSIMLGSGGNRGKWPEVREKLIGAFVTKVEIFGHLPEIYISFSNGLRAVSFTIEEDEKQPGWTILIGNDYLCVREGRLSTGTSGP